LYNVEGEMVEDWAELLAEILGDEGEKSEK